MYYATLEKNNGEIETVNNIRTFETEGHFLYLYGEDFHMFVSSSHYAVIKIEKGSL